MDKLKLERIAAHEGGHAIARLACGLSLVGITIDREVARSKTASENTAGCVWGLPDNYACNPLEAFSDVPLHELAGEEFSFATCVFCYARTISFLAGREAERIFFDQPPDSYSGSDVQAAAFLVTTITNTRKAALVLLDHARIDAARILAARKHQVEIIAAALLEQKTLDGQEIDAILSGRPDALRRKRWTATAASAELFKTMTDGGLKRLNLVYGC
jgi:hypothetical protein